MEIVNKKISDLKPRPDNPRQSNKSQEDDLKKSLEKFGVVEPIIFNKQSGYIVGGHFRVRELKKMGVKEVPCVVVDLNEDDEKELNIRLNANTGAWDYDILANQWDADLLTEWGVELPDFTPKIKKKEELKDFKTSHILISYNPNRHFEVTKAIENLTNIEDIEIETASN